MTRASKDVHAPELDARAQARRGLLDEIDRSMWRLLRAWSQGVVELTTRGRYAVTAMAELAMGPAASALALSTIAERQQISLAYLEQIFSKLRRAGLVESARGRAGGYRLARPASDIRVSEVMAAVEEDMRMTRCGGEAATCLPGRRCIAHGLWDALSNHIEGFLAGISLQQVIDGLPAQKTPDALVSLPGCATSPPCATVPAFARVTE